MAYPIEIHEYVNLRMEQECSDTKIAKEVLNKFPFVTTGLRALRSWVGTRRDAIKKKKSKGPLKRLFFDIETSYHLARIWHPGKQYVGPERIQKEKKIICISYKWQGSDKVSTLTWDKEQDDATMLKKFIPILGDADEIVGHNGDRFDIPELRTRCVASGVLMFPSYRTLDTLKKARSYFRFPSNKLDYLGKYLNVGRKLDHAGLDLWIDVVEKKDKKALETMVKYCEQDVILLEDVYHVLSPYISHNTNFAVLKGGSKWECPECSGDNVELCHTYTTAMGIVRRNMKCNGCKKQYRVSNKTYQKMLEKVGNL